MEFSSYCTRRILLVGEGVNSCRAFIVTAAAACPPTTPLMGIVVSLVVAIAVAVAVVMFKGAMEISAAPPSSGLETIIVLFGCTSAVCNRIVGAVVLLLPILLLLLKL